MNESRWGIAGFVFGGGVMFFWVGGGGGGRGGSGFIMRHASVRRREPPLCWRAGAFFGAAFLSCLGVFLRQRQLRINVGIAQMSCLQPHEALTVLFVIISRASAVVSCRQCRLLIPEEAIPTAPSPLSSLSLSSTQLENGRRNGQHEILKLRPLAPFPLPSLCLIPRGTGREGGGSYDVVCQSNQLR